MEQRDVVRYGLAAILAEVPEVTDLVSARRLDDEAASAATNSVDVMVASTAALTVGDSTDERAGLTAHRTILLLTSAAPDELDLATAAEVDGYLVLDDATAESIRSSLVRVLDGEMPLPAKVASHLLRRVHAGDELRIPRWVRLSPREDEVLRLLVEGLSNRQIAAALDISVHAVKRHVSNLLSKFDVGSRTHLASQVLQARAVPLPPQR